MGEKTLTLPADIRESRIHGHTVRRYDHPLGFSVAELVMPDQEVNAAIGAMLSRDPGALEDRLKRMNPSMKENILGRYFRNYGHSSIGEMGHLFLTVENISMVGAMYTVMFGRFSGQEASTRYSDFRGTDYFLPTVLRDNETAHATVREWFGLYGEVYSILMDEYLRQGIPERESKPRALDVAGAFLPVAARTGVVLTSDIRNLIEHAWDMQSYRRHEEMNGIGGHLLAVINRICPNSVKTRTRTEFEHLEDARYAVLHESSLMRSVETDRSMKPSVSLDLFRTEEFRMVADRVIRSRLPTDMLGSYGVIGARADISFRSLRDLLRHRPFSKKFLPPWSGHEFTVWYLAALPEQYRKNIAARVTTLLETVQRDFSWRGYCTPCLEYGTPLQGETALYLLPMGFRVRCEMVGTVDKWLHLLRLRTGNTVHPEVRAIVQQWTRGIAAAFSVRPGRLGDMSGSSDYEKRSEYA